MSTNNDFKRLEADSDNNILKKKCNNQKNEKSNNLVNSSEHFQHRKHKWEHDHNNIYGST